ncbi:MAG: transglutaminase protein [Rhodocyclaceae bacterium]|nr:transglutaminase protein [Rhodocyclaceae bacterium]
MQRYLESTPIIDWRDPGVQTLARELAGSGQSPEAVARRCFEWVRDEIKHSRDYQLQAVTCSASEVLRVGSGYCYAKSHLLAALLRANGIPAGLCYQRLSRDDKGAPFCLHGLNAVHLPAHGWYRVDPRGNREGIDAQFTPPVERLAFPIRLTGEADIPGIFAEPLPVVVKALRSSASADALWLQLPDMESGCPTAATESGS